MKEEFYVERIVRIVAGTFVLVSLLLAHFHSPNWLWFTGFVGLNLFQSGFTQFCPMFNMAIVDEMMPGSKGHELASCLKGYEPSFPILMISAFPMGKFSGIDDFLLKPVVPESLYQFVARLLNIEMPALAPA